MESSLARRTARVLVPATSANLGPGFDTIGVALSWHNEFDVQIVSVAPPRLVPGALALPNGSLAHDAMAVLFETVGEAMPDVFIQSVARVPFSRGLGSSSTAVVGGLLAANALLGHPLNPERVLELAVRIEGHPDNVAPALFGGFQIAVADHDGSLTRVSVPAPTDLRAVVCIPERILSTHDARAALPDVWSRAQTVGNLGRVAVLMTALLTDRRELLRVGMTDCLHQPYRAPLVPGFDDAVAAALESGAFGAALSGSGSAILALTDKNEAAIGAAMVDAIRSASAPGDPNGNAQWIALDLDNDGARMIETIETDG